MTSPAVSADFVNRLAALPWRDYVRGKASHLADKMRSCL